MADKIGILDVLYGHAVELSEYELYFSTLQDLSAIVYHATLVEMSDEFKQRLKDVYASDPHWTKVLSVITPKGVVSQSPPAVTSGDVASSTPPAANDHATQTTSSSVDHLPRDDTTETSASSVNQPSRGIRFRLRDGLIYYVFGDNDSKDRLCIPASIEEEVFRMAHDLSSYGGFYRVYDRLVNSVFVRHLAKRFRVYIEYCFKCQLHQTKRHSLYGSLQSIDTPAISFHTVAIDFILALSSIDGYDCVMTVTCKFIKKFMTIFGKSTWDAEDWVNVFIIALMTRD